MCPHERGYGVPSTKLCVISPRRAKAKQKQSSGVIRPKWLTGFRIFHTRSCCCRRIPSLSQNAWKKHILNFDGRPGGIPQTLQSSHDSGTLEGTALSGLGIPHRPACRPQKGAELTQRGRPSSQWSEQASGVGASTTTCKARRCDWSVWRQSHSCRKPPQRLYTLRYVPGRQQRHSSLGTLRIPSGTPEMNTVERACLTKWEAVFVLMQDRATFTKIPSRNSTALLLTPTTQTTIDPFITTTAFPPNFTSLTTFFPPSFSVTTSMSISLLLPISTPCTILNLALPSWPPLGNCS